MSRLSHTRRLLERLGTSDAAMAGATVAQGTDSWHAARAQYAMTSSQMGSLVNMGEAYLPPAAAYKQARSRILGTPPADRAATSAYVARMMDHGNRHESRAVDLAVRGLQELQHRPSHATYLAVEYPGIMPCREFGPRVGASPDALTTYVPLPGYPETYTSIPLEVKAPAGNDCAVYGCVPERYLCQLYAQMDAADAPYGHFASYDANRDVAELWRVWRDKLLFDELKTRVAAYLRWHDGGYRDAEYPDFVGEPPAAYAFRKERSKKIWPTRSVSEDNDYVALLGHVHGDGHCVCP